MSFFMSGEVDTKSIDRAKLSEGVYHVRLSDFADHLGAFSGSRTQVDFIVTAGPRNVGDRKGHIVGHSYDKEWKAAKARGEIATMLGAFMGLTAEASGFKIDGPTFLANTRIVKYASGGKDVADISRDASELALVKSGAEAVLVVKPYFGKDGKRKMNPKTGLPSVIYTLLPMSCGLAAGDSVGGSDDSDEAPPSPDSLESDALELALADGWKANGESGWFYKKGEPAQLKAPALRAKYAVSY